MYNVWILMAFRQETLKTIVDKKRVLFRVFIKYWFFFNKTQPPETSITEPEQWLPTLLLLYTICFVSTLV